MPGREIDFCPRRRKAHHGRRWWATVGYRVWQVIQGMWPWDTTEEVREAAQWLSPPALSLWQQQPRRDRRHSLRVLRTLQRWGQTHPALMQAALLHDVGKSLARIRLWHRAVWVLVQAVNEGWAERLAHPEGWRFPFWVLAEHPRLGAALAQQAGCDPDAVWLIAHHQDVAVTEHPSRQQWLACLQAADELC